jgi:hypothetical protein
MDSVGRTYVRSGRVCVTLAAVLEESAESTSVCALASGPATPVNINCKTIIRCRFISRVSWAHLRSTCTPKVTCCSSNGKRTRFVVALARNLHLFGSCVPARFAAVFVVALRLAPAGQMGACALFTCRHRSSPFAVCPFADNLDACCSPDVYRKTGF